MPVAYFSATESRIQGPMRLFWYDRACKLNKSLESDAKSKHFPAPLTPSFGRQRGPATAMPLRVTVEKPTSLVSLFMKNPKATARIKILR